MKRLTFILPSYLICLLALSSGCTQQSHEEKLPTRPVKAFRVGENVTDSAMSFAGEVRPRYETTLSFRVAGKIISRPVEAGDRVHKGQLLASLDASDYQLGVQALKAQLKAAKAESDFTRNDLTRYQELLSQRVISQPEFERRETAYTTAMERVAALEAQLSQTDNQLGYTNLIADHDGIVTKLEIETGQVVTAGQAIIKLARLDEKEIQMDIPEQRIGYLHVKQDINVTLWATGDKSYKARIREIAATADPSSRTYSAKATLLEGLDDARLGMTATAWIPAHANSIMTVPLSAVFTPQNKPAQPRVWLVDEKSGTVKSVPIQIGKVLNGEQVAISGLASGQLIVSAGVQRLAEGQTVRLLAQKSSIGNRSLAEVGEHQ
jgi:multidrug efflux system membrane fusion protein